jgi:riboflavin kinase
MSSLFSVGRNPFYKNEKKTIEPHLLHSFETDFYGEELRLVVTGYLRPEKNYSSLDALIAAIHADISLSRQQLEAHPQNAFGEHGFLKPST